MVNRGESIPNSAKVFLFEDRLTGTESTTDNYIGRLEAIAPSEVGIWRKAFLDNSNRSLLKLRTGNLC